MTSKPNVKRPAGRKIYTPSTAFENETFGMDGGARRIVRALFAALTDDQKAMALCAMGWVKTQEEPTHD